MIGRTKLFQQLKNGLDPIPVQYKYLTSTFGVEAIYTLRRIIRIIGLGQITSVIFSLFINYSDQTGSLLFINLALFISGLLFIGLSFKPFRRLPLFKLVFIGQLLILLCGGLAAWQSGEFRPTLILFLLVASLSTLFPWFTTWNVALQSTIILTTIGFYIPLWRQGQITSLDTFLFVVLILVTLISVYIHGLNSVQRWRSFLNRHKNYLLNAKLETSNMKLEVLNEQLHNELALAHDVQISLMPSPFPEWPGFDIVCYNKPAQEIGGDFYSHHQLTKDRFAFAVGDVSGKGVSAALLMATTLSLFDASLRRRLSPAALLTHLDQVIAMYTQSHQQNCSLCYLEIEGGEVTVANAAGIPPYICEANGVVKAVEVGGLPLGQMAESQLGYDEHSFKLAEGDFVVVTSDGVVEALNEHNEIFGFTRLEHTLATNPATTAQGMLEHILADLTTFTQGTELYDDLTLVVFKLAF